MGAWTFLQKKPTFPEKIHLKHELKQLTLQNDFVLEYIKKRLWGVRSRPDKVSYGLKEDHGGETIGLMTLFPAVLLFADKF